jgi:hypothetical protein
MSESVCGDGNAIRQMIKLDHMAIYFHAEFEITYLFDWNSNQSAVIGAEHGQILMEPPIRIFSRRLKIGSTKFFLQYRTPFCRMPELFNKYLYRFR